MTVRFDVTRDQPGFEVIDPIERRRCRLRTGRPVEPSTVTEAPFDAPVDRAIRITTAALALDELVGAYVRDETGAVVATATSDTDLRLPPDGFTIELTTTIKLYVQAATSGRIVAGYDGIRITLDEPAEVVVGARSFHTRPAATITTTPDPRDVLHAVSMLSSALKTTSCERSFPTLRGHPPTIELGEELAVPDGLDVPDTGVTIEVPPRLATAYAVSPLAYYLGATLEPATSPRLVTDEGYVHDLPDGPAFESAIEQLLQQVFFLDCLTRSEGRHQLDLHERRVVEPLVDLDFSAIYDRPLARQLEAYLSVPFDVIEPHAPPWSLTAYLEPDPAHVEVLPFVVDDLAVVRTARRSSAPLAAGVNVDRTESADHDAGQSAGYEASELAGYEANIEGPAPGPDGQPLVELPEAPSIERTWFGEGVPIGATKGLLRAHRNRLARSSKSASIEIAVVCNDSSMFEESAAVADAYGSHDDLPFDVTIHEELSVAQLRSVLTSPVDFLHYVGHIDEAGFRCRDGALDVSTLDAVGMEAFLLNACQSYRQGVALIEAGSVGGVVTMNDVVNASAVRMGYSMARLLELGFPLQASLAIAREESVIGGQYLVVGDGAMDVVQEQRGVPTLCSSERAGERYAVTIQTYLSRDSGMGSIVYPFVEHNDEYFLAPGALPPFEVSEAELEQLLEWHRVPLRVDGRLVWRDDASPIG